MSLPQAAPLQLPPSLRRRLAQKIVTSILLAIVAFSALFEVLQARPLLVEVARADAARAARNVAQHFRGVVASAESLVQ